MLWGLTTLWACGTLTSRRDSSRRTTQVATMIHNRIVGLGAAGVLGLASVLTAFGQESTDEAKQLVERAQELAKAEKFDEAARLMRQALRLDPRHHKDL